MAEYLEDLLTVDNISGQVYTIHKLEVTNPEIKAQELTTLLRLLLAPGIYQSIDQAIDKGVPEGTFVIIDNPETPETEFDVQVVKSFLRER